MSIERLETERLIGERLSPVHRPHILGMFQNKAVCATLGGVLSAEMVDRTMVTNLDHWRRHGFGIWVFTLGDSGAFVGRAGLRRVQLNGRDEIELAYTVMPEFWNKGFATEMGQAALRVGFEELSLQDVQCFTLTTNFASQRVMAKLGFQFERVGDHAHLPHIFFRLTADEILRRKARLNRRAFCLGPC